MGGRTQLKISPLSCYCAVDVCLKWTLLYSIKVGAGLAFRDQSCTKGVLLHGQHKVHRFMVLLL